ncbi:uncharacterized protein RJT20DRAFT_137360 [Scheffersomyces xylosifermentans]|uniref:uncharacterized protein n=1 Tax=Scheffersomyces xylosifermentans TaxID=1304137 RepID=UPI00315CFA23
MDIVTLILACNCIMGIANGFVVRGKLTAKHFLDLGPLCINERYSECHMKAQENYLKCSSLDKLCLCYYIKAVHEECIKLCVTYHHETYYRMTSLCLDKNHPPAIMANMPVEHIREETTPGKLPSTQNGSTHDFHGLNYSTFFKTTVATKSLQNSPILLPNIRNTGLTNEATFHNLPWSLIVCPITTMVLILLALILTI